MPIFASPDGLDTNTGTTATSPWSLSKGIAELHSAGQDVLYLRGGTYLERVDIVGLGNPNDPHATPKVIRSCPGERAIIDPTIPEFRTVPNDQWKQVGHTDEYVSEGVYESDEGRAWGSFLDRAPYTRLINHQFLQDLQSDNELAGPICDDNPLPGPEPRPLPNPPSDQPHATYPRRPWIYLGPGIHWTSDDRKIHVRLSPTHNGLAGFPDYDGESDPRKVPLAIWTQRGPAFRIKGCRALRISDITIRHREAAVVIRDSTDIHLDHVDMFAGNTGIRLRGTCHGLVITHCLVDGGLPPWHFRSDRKNGFHLPSDVDDKHPHAPGENTMDSLLDGLNSMCYGTVINHCEFVNGHDIYTFGTQTTFSHNWIRNINDDAIVIDTKGSADVRIFGNVVEQCQTAISSGTDNAAGGTAIYRNIIDMRRPTAKNRPHVYEEAACHKLDPAEREVLARGVLYKSTRPDGPLDFFQNTCLTKDNTARVSFNHFSLWGDSQRNVFNNLFIAVNTVPPSDKFIALLPDLSDNAATDGNCFYRTGQYVASQLLRRRFEGGVESFGSLREFHGYPTANDPLQPDDVPTPPSPYFLSSQTVYPPGFEATSIERNPLFRLFNPAQNGPAGNDDLRLSIDSPARNAGIELPSPLDNLDTEPHATHPDIGCLPYGAAPLAVGVDARRRFPNTEPPA